MMVGDPYGTPNGTFARRGQVAHIHVGSSWGITFGMFWFDLRFALVAFDLIRDSIWCEGVGVGVGARGGSTWAGGDFLRGALGWERRANLRTTNTARSHTHTQAQATQPLHRGPPTLISTAFQHRPVPRGRASSRSAAIHRTHVLSAGPPPPAAGACSLAVQSQDSLSRAPWRCAFSF